MPKAYKNPTEDAAIGNIIREERKKKRKLERERENRHKQEQSKESEVKRNESV